MIEKAKKATDDDYEELLPFGSKWEDTLSNFLYLYKNFDWKNNVVLIYGG